MEITLTPDQELLVAYGIEVGPIQSAEDAIRQAPEIWDDLKGARAELIALIDEGDAAFEAGEYTEYDEDGLHELLKRIKRQGRERLAMKTAVAS